MYILRLVDYAINTTTRRGVAMLHILVSSSSRAVGPVTRELEYLLPQYRNMATKAGSVNFNTKHLKKGDPLPPYNGKLRLYNMRYCPFAQRTVLALIAKKIDFEVINVNLMEKPEWLTSKSPFGKVPSIEIRKGLSIYESLITVEYLDEAYPERPLMAKDPVRRAYDKIIVEAAGAITSFAIKILKFPETITEDHIANFNSTLQFIQEQLQSRDSKFLSGAQPGFVDYMIWPWFEKLQIASKWDSRAKVDGQKFKLLVNYLNEMLKDPVVVEYQVPEDVFLKYFDSYKSGKVDYDLLFQK